MNRREHLSQRPQRGLHRSLIPTMRPLDTKRKALVAVVDIGTSKTTCLVARLTPHPAPEALPRRSHAVKILGIGYCNSRGIKAGAVSNFEQVEQAVRQAFDSAEGHTFEVQSVVLSVSGGRIASESLSALLDVAGMVSDEAITRVLAAASPASVWNGRATLHCLPNSYSIDAAKGIHDPRKMLARRLGVDVVVVSVDAVVARDLILTLESCHVNVEAMVASPYAAGLSVLSEDEMELGAAVIDMGAGTTTMAVFSAGRLLHVKRLRTWWPSHHNGFGSLHQCSLCGCLAYQNWLWIGAFKGHDEHARCWQ